MSARIVLVTGGARSGKSRYALHRALAYSQRAFIATATACDAEMADRIDRHKAERAEAFVTVEEPIDLAGALRRLPAGTEVALIDCLTLWLANLMQRFGAEADTYAPIEALKQALAATPCDILMVTNEVGMGIVPDNALARRFRDLAGRLNATLAARADEVVLLVSGLPLTLKGPVS